MVGAILQALYTSTDLFFAINLHYNNTMDTIMYYTTMMGQGEVVITVLLALLAVPRLRNWWYFLTALFCNIIPFFIQQGLKIVFNAPRPFNYLHNDPRIHYLYKWPYLSEKSFPSGHSAGAFSFFCFLALLLPKQYRSVGLVFFLLALAVCYSRVYLTAHFFADVYAGSIVGTVVTTFIFSIMMNYKDRFFTKKGTAI